MTYQFVIFDFDGTLADSLPWFIRAMNELAPRFSFRPLGPEEQQQVRSLPPRALMKHLRLPLWKVPLVAAALRAKMQDHIHEIPLFQGVDRLLQGLRQRGVMQGMVSSNDRENITRLLGEHAECISHFECGVPLFGKSSRLKKLARASGLPREQILFVGDEVRDSDAAGQAGMPFGAVSWGYSAITALEARKPAEVFRSIDDILARFSGA